MFCLHLTKGSGSCTGGTARIPKHSKEQGRPGTSSLKSRQLEAEAKAPSLAPVPLQPGRASKMASVCLFPCPNTHPLLSLGQRGPAGGCSQPGLCTLSTLARGRGQAAPQRGGGGPCLGSQVALGVPRGLAATQNQCAERTLPSLGAGLGLEPRLHPPMTSEMGRESDPGQTAGWGRAEHTAPAAWTRVQGHPWR